jgi:hypothetical protein
MICGLLNRNLGTGTCEEIQIFLELVHVGWVCGDTASACELVFLTTVLFLPNAHRTLALSPNRGRCWKRPLQAEPSN